jgi:toxin ParE1/3/4
VAERYQIFWAAVAEADLAAIVGSLAERSPVSAARVLEAIEHRAATLRTSPLRGRVVPELARFEISDYRETLEGHYRIVYAVRGRRVFVLGVMDGRRDFATTLLGRLIR